MSNYQVHQFIDYAAAVAAMVTIVALTVFFMTS